MIVDEPASLAALGARAGAGALAPLGAPATARDEFTARLWAACAAAGPGWRVAPEAAAVLAPPGWDEILVCGRVGRSPYLALREVASDRIGLPGPVACLTLGGGGLEGQHGRRWCAEPGNLHLSVAVPCDLPAATCGPPLPMLAAVALCEAVEALVGPDAATRAGLGLKWVNDIVLAGGKAGGVLTALRAEGERITAYFAGLALNLATAPALAPDPFALPATALANATGTAWPGPTLASAAAAVLERLRARLHELAAAGPDGPDGLVAAYRERSVVLGREVAIWPAGTRERLAATPGALALPPPGLCGRVVAVERDLSLRLAGRDEPVRDGCLRLDQAPPGPRGVG